jgi:osmotically-inducible protein OsmY
MPSFPPEKNMKIFNGSFFKLISISLLSLILVVMMGCTATSKQESTGEYIDDSYITTKVKSQILGDPDLKVLEINVETFKGVVQLSGFVSSREDINKAIRIAENVKGVKSVKNDMRVK